MSERQAPERAGPRWIGVAGALLVGTAVALGALGAHALKPLLTPAHLATFETALLYQLVHGLGLLAVFALDDARGRLRLPAALLLAGAFIFSASLYLLVATDIGVFGATAPIGGTAMILGWALLAIKLGWRDRPGA